jgi:parallel beta-helix repeat protein
MVSGCEASNNATGFRLDTGSTLRDCSAPSNAGYGIDATGTNGVTVAGCTVLDGDGIVAGSGALIEDCVVVSSGLEGIRLDGNGSTVRGCHVRESVLQGINAIGSNSAVIGNTISGSCCAAIWLQGDFSSAEDNHISSVGYGVFVSGFRVTVEDNTVSAAATAGIYAEITLSEWCTIEGNTVNGSSTGYFVAPDSECIVIRNVAVANTTPYNIGAGNDAGPISSGTAATSPTGNVTF